ncbi:hypothetical protein IKU74_03210 [bacterium]|nr:hypothetical protein [bacterium]
MDISGVSAKAYASVLNEDEKMTKPQDEKVAEDTAKAKKDERDMVMVSASEDFSANGVEEKASNYIQNLIATTLLTEESKAQIVEYLNNFDAEKFIRAYGPFSSTSEVSAALYAVTSGMVKRQEEE